MECQQDKLIESKEDVSDVLYILGYLNGEHWARNNDKAGDMSGIGLAEPCANPNGS